ncbi:phenoloxidase-activating factor 3 [Leptinotarsa decemlineata]|uniref:phenoloxidase-activating factor 3 n=1 Tax=Leptinotarsa decemlineata TaxID=7539 RepID=UPI003D305353
MHQCNFKGNRPYVCCNTTSDERTDATKDQLESNIITDTIISHRNYHLLPQNVCGPIIINIPRIMNGELSDLGEFPWMALIAYTTDADGKLIAFNCAGTLITERFVLTAAHCTGDSMIGVRLGEYDLQRKEDCDPATGYCAPPTQDFLIESVFIHPQYKANRLLNDIALIKLYGTADLSYENVKPICLPTQDDEMNGHVAVVSGWGVTENQTRSPILRQVPVEVVEFSECQKIYRPKVPLTRNQVCAGISGEKNSCAGDSGGPLKYVGPVHGSPRFIQYGIVSYGPRKCGTDGEPDIYTKIFSYMNWILDHLDK